MRKIVAFLTIAILVLFTNAKAQIAVTVTGAANTTPALSASYTTLSDALNGLNAVTAMTGPVTFTLAAGASETAPLTGFTVGSATLNPVLSATNTVTIVKDAGSATVLNAAAGGTTTPTSAAPNGILKIAGADYVTIDGLTLTDGNAANPASMEFGLGIFKLSATDGAQNNTIQNCIINMQRVNNASSTAPMVEGSVGILMINATPTAATTVLTVTAASGTNSNNKFYSNTINSGNYGMALIGFAGSSPFTTCDQGTIVGASGLGNSILNFGGGAATNPSAGIRTLAQYGISIGYNTVNNNNGSGVNHATTLRGIYLNTATSASATITNNTVSIQGGGTTSTVSAIDNQSGSTAASNTINITNNTVNIGYPTASSGVYNGIINGSSAATVNINGNTIGQISGVALAGTGTCVMIEGGSPGGALNTNNNTVANINRTGASGSWRGIKATTPTGLWTCSGNTVENLSWTAAASTGSTDGIYDLSSATLININTNIVRNLSTPTTGTINGININTVSGTHSCTNNQIYNFTTTAGGAGGATFTGIVFSVGNTTISGNTIYALNSTGTTGGTGGSIQGIRQGGGTTNLISKNKVYDLSSTSTNPTVIGINASGGTTTTVQNNLVGDLRATAANASNAIRGIDVANTTTNLYFNTVYINASSSGAVFGTSAINTSTSTTLDMRNNIFVNLSSFNTTGLTVAYRRASTTLTSYANTSNNNFFYAGTPGASNLIFNDGTNSDQTIGAFQSRVSPRDNVSVSEAVSSTAGVFFQSFTGANANFLHMVGGLTTLVESGASVIGSITDDYDSDVRSLVKPDIGADEFSGISPAPVVTFNSITPSVTQCVATARAISVTATTPGGTITGVTITYNNGTLNSNIPMTNTSGDIWEYTIPAASPSNTTVTWSVVATNSLALTTTYIGASYTDDPLNGGVLNLTASPSSVCSGSPSSLSASLILNNTAPSGYCSVTFTNTTEDDIGQVTFAGINNPAVRPTPQQSNAASTNVYTDFTAIPAAQVVGGSTYPMTVYHFHSTTDVSANFCNVYIDFNRNGSFEDAGELFALTKVGGAFLTDFTGNITIPANALPGNTRMRVLLREGAITSPCGSNSSWGEAEDYIVNIAANAGTYFSSVVWNDGANNFGTTSPVTVNPTTTTNYSATATDPFGCTISSVTPVTVTTIPLPTAPGTGSFPSFQCGSGVPNTAFVTGGTAGQYRWYTFDGSSYTLIPGETDASLTTYSISATTTFYVAINDGTCESSKTAVVANVVAPDPVSASSDGPVCANSPLTLTATVTSGTVGNIYTYEWTALPAAGSGIPTTQAGSGTGTFGTPVNTIVTPTAGGSYTYTVTATDGPCVTTANVTVTVNAQPVINTPTAVPSTICDGQPSVLTATTTDAAPGIAEIGTATTLSGSSDVNTAFNNRWPSARTQLLYTAAELQAQGMLAGNITSIAFNINSLGDAATNADFRVKIGNTALSALTAFVDTTTGFTNVYNPKTYTHTATGWQTITFDAPFNWDGTSNIVVQVVMSGADALNNSLTYYTATATNQAAYTATASTNAATLSLNRLNIRFGAIVGTNGPGTLNWSWDNGGGTGNSVTVTPSATTLYTVTATDLGTTCSNTATVNVTVLPLPDAPIGTSSQQCGTGVPSASVATGGANGTGVFKWYLVPSGGTAIAGESGTTLTSYSISTPTSFYVSEVGTNGCESPRTQVDVTFDFTPDVLELSASPSPICLGQSFTFSLAQTGGGNAFIFNFPSTLHAAGSGINIPNIDGIDSNLLDLNSLIITPTAPGTYTYTVRGFDPDKGCISEDQTTVVVNPLPTITSFTVTPSPVCEGSVINLKAENIQSSPGSSSIGTQTTTEFGGGVYRYGFGTGDFRHQLLYTASELTAAGFVAGNLTSLSFNVTSVGSGSSNNYTIKLAHTAATALTTTFQTATFTTCYVAPTYTAVSGTNLHTFTTPFAWDGTSNLLVEICYNVSTIGSTSTVGATTPAFTGNTNLLGTAGACTAATGSTFANRPFATFGGQVGVNLTGNYNWVFNPGAISGGTTGTATTIANTGITSYTATATSISTGCYGTTSAVNITVNPLPLAPVSGGDVSRCGPGSVTLGATGSGGTLNWFNVSSGGTSLGTGGSFTTNVTASTSFWVEETSAAGCIGPRTQVNVTVTTAPTLAITPGGATTFCNGGSVVLDAGALPTDPSYINFSWSPGGATTASITANPAVTTTYTVTADDGAPNGCSNTAQVTITVNPNPTINPVTANPISICAGASSTLTATTNIVGAGTATIGTGTSLTGATSQPTAFNNRWPSYRMQLVFTAAELQAAGLTAGNLTSLAFNITTLGDEDFNDNFRIKIGNTALSTLTAFADTTSGFTDVYTPKTYTHAVGLNTIPFDAPFNWDGTSNIIVQVCMLGADNVNNSQTYYTATTGNTIAFTATNETNAASLSTNRLNVVFGGQVQTTGAGPYNWLWNPGALPGNVVTVTPTSTQAYSVTATDPVTSCFTTVNNAVTVSVLPVAANATATPAVICLGQSSTLNSNGTGGLPLTYSWTVAGNPTVLGTAATLSVSPAATTIYEVTVTDACGNPTTSQVTVTVNSLPSVTVSPITASICQPGATPVSLTADGAVTYTWAPATGLSAASGTSVDASPNVTTTYTVTGADANGCTDTAQAVIVVGATVQNLTASASLSTVCSGSPTVLTASAYVPRPVGSYTFSTAATGGTLDPMTGATEIVADSTDDTPMNLGFSTNTTAGNKIPIGFTFNINNTDYTYFGASPDGWVTFGNDNTAPSSDFGNGVTDATNIPKVYPYWDDLATGVGGSVKYLVTGSAPNRILIVEWFVTIPRATTGAANSRFQAWMYENGGKVEFRYGTMGSGTMSASVGVTGGTTQYQSVTVSTNASSNSSANNSNSGQPASGRIYSFVPTATFTWNPGNLTGASVTVNPTSTTVYTVTASSGFCTDTEDVTITANPLTVITVDASPTSQLVAQNTTATPLTVAATGTNVTYAWYSNATNSSIGGTFVGSGSSYAPSTTATGILYYYAVATGDCGLDTSSVVNVETVDANTNFWTGAAGSNWSTPGSWSLNAVPTILNDAVIPTGATPYPILSATSTAKNLLIQSGATVSLNGQTLNIVETVDPIGTGTFIGSATSNLSVGATSTLRFASGAGGVIKNLSINGGTTTLATALDVTGGTGASNVFNNNTNGVVTVANGATLASGGNLTFKSNQWGTARLAQGATTGQWVTGNVTVERYIPANAQRAWRFLSVPTKGLQTIKQSWQENGTAGNTNPKPGYGTNLSTPLAAYGALGFDERTAKASIQFFNQATGAWVDVNSTLSGGNVPKIESVKGYSVYVRGDRTQYASGAVTSTTPTTLRTTGTLYTGDQAAISIGANKFDLIGNTYVSAIDFLGLTRTNMVNTFYLWDPKLVTGTPPNQSLGGYVTFSLANGFVGVPNSSSYGITPRTTIQPGESFMVQANASGPASSITLRESSKVIGDGINYFRPAAPTTGFEKMKANLFTVAANNTAVMADANVSVFDNLFSNAVDGDDAVKLVNAGENFAIRRGATNLVVEGRQTITDYDTTFFWIWNLRQNIQYRLELIAENMNVTGRTAFLIDGYTNTTTQLDLAGGVTNYDFTINTDNLSFSAGRFKIVYRQVQPSPVPVSFVSVSAQPAGTAINVNWKVAQETGIRQYVVERSSDGRNFAAGANVSATGNRGGDVSYSWLDATPLTGTNFYRIRSVGLNGEIKYSPIVKVLTGKTLPSFTVAPNPVEGSVVNIQFKNQEQGKYAIRLLAVTGEAVFTVVKEHAGGSSTQVLNLPAGLARGTYQLEIISPSKVREVQNLFINTLK